MLTCFRLKKGRATFFQPETIVENFFASYGVTFQSVTKSFFKMPVFGALLSYDSYGSTASKPVWQGAALSGPYFHF